MKPNAAVAALLLLASAPALAQDERVGAAIRAWRSELEGKVSSQGGSLGTSDVDFVSDLGLDGTETEFEFTAFVQIPFFGRLRGAWWTLDRVGDEVLSQSISFAGEVFTASTRVESTIGLDVYTFGYEFVFPTIPVPVLGGLELAAGLAAKAVHGEVSIRSVGQDASDSGWVGLPVLSARASMELTRWARAEAGIEALTFSVADRRVTYAEASLELVVRPLPWVFAGAGYKFTTIDLKDESGDTDFDLDVDVKGFFLTAGLRF